jgi:hypothetical protein
VETADFDVAYAAPADSSFCRGPLNPV